MPAVKCGVNGCGRRLQPLMKVDPRDRDTWIYPECEACGQPACEGHTSWFEGRVVCDRCQARTEGQGLATGLIELGLRV
ncbi:MAG TPA: hypothetical protein VD866_31700 [Urbifossiella sp.]|nr:hypothetical protein [Urbifossiella sp.]